MSSRIELGTGRAAKVLVLLATAGSVCTAVYVAHRTKDRSELPNRIPEAAPYVTAEARVFPPPYEDSWKTDNHPGQCQTCHEKIFNQWNGSMMSNAWRDPVWRAAFLLLARATSAHGECDTPEPPDGTPKAKLNPFAVPGQCASTFDLGIGKQTLSRPGSLLDFFCSRCHMPTNYLDNVPLRNVHVDPATGVEHAPGDSRFHPTSDNGTGIAFATVDAQYRNTSTGQSGIFCAVCHSVAGTRDTPFHNHPRAGSDYIPALGKQPRSELVPPGHGDLFEVADASARNLGYAIGAGAFRLSPHALALAERFGPLSAGDPAKKRDENSSQVFEMEIPYQKMDSSKHDGYHHAMLVRSEMCAACHDVTNALPIKNPLGKWVGGFPIERTYTEWVHSRYADRPGNANFDPKYKRDCQTCHMQQDYGQPGTAQTLYQGGHPLPPPVDRVASEGGSPRPFFTHHFVGGNAFVPRLIGKALDGSGSVSPYPELSAFSFSSADHKSPYSRAFWTNVERRGEDTQQARLAWDRLRHVLSMDLDGPRSARASASAPIAITITNTGSGHNFPTGFPEGRTAWLAVHAYDLASGYELPIHDSVWNRTSTGVGLLTTEEMLDPNFPGCQWKIPAGSADPYSVQFKAVASLGDGCPTLDLPYAAPLNLVTNAQGLPVDEGGRVIDRDNPAGLPQFRDVNANGDLFDDSYLRDTRLKPLPHPGATVKVDRYSIAIPPGTRGPIAVAAAVYYQSLEAVVALKFLGNMADTNGNFELEPCVLGGLCDGRRPKVEPPVVEGSPPVPMIVRNWVIGIDGAPADTGAPQVATYPAPGAVDVYRDVVVKASFSKPVRGVDSRTFTLTDSQGARVPAWVDQIGDGTWGLFPDQVFSKPGERYTARLADGICDTSDNCSSQATVWSFTIATDRARARGDTSVPAGFGFPRLVSVR
jgi:Bacterial Ig-like domain